MSAFTPIEFRLISTNHTYSRRNYFNLHFTYSLQVLCCCIHQLTVYEKEIQMYQNLFHDYHLVYIWRQCEIHQRQFQIPLFFFILFFDLLKQSRLDFSNLKSTFVRIQLLGSYYGKTLFSDLFVPKASKTFSTLFLYYLWLKVPEVWSSVF